MKNQIKDKNIDIKSLSVESIKAMLYDQLVVSKRTETNINILQNRLQELEQNNQNEIEKENE